MDFQEYEAVLEVVLPIGFRQGHAAVPNAPIQITREKAILVGQGRKLLCDLASVVAECDRARTQVVINLNRYLAAGDALGA